MENILKNSGKVILFACLSLILLTGCDQKSKLKLGIEAANKQCPMKMGTVGEVSSITYDGTDVVYLLTMNEDYIDLEALDKKPEAVKAAAVAMFRNPEKNIKEMLNLVIDSNSGIKFVYKGQTSGKEVSCYLGTEDLKNLLNQDMSKEESDQKKLEELVNVTNVSCPMAIDEATTLNNLTIESDRVVYHYTVDEESMEIATMKENEGEIKQNIKSSLDVSEPALKMFLEACIKSNKGLGYQYAGNTSGESVEIIFSVSEIKALL
ncbi:hypothetical protein [Bacteroides sp.]|uniref:hypothetical protein n=1 Tax=Bacteroides sp. TaxID=29523 RepID=UPI002620AFF4|nr:hypothetical protein [Bacteroides sp.]